MYTLYNRYAMQAIRFTASLETFIDVTLTI